MSFAIRRAALQAARTQRAPAIRQTRRYASEESRSDVLQKGAKRDPELYVRTPHYTTPHYHLPFTDHIQLLTTHSGTCDISS